jgi:hypothetical protein
MKYTWSEEDIVAGRIVCREERPTGEVCGWTAKWTFKIGFGYSKDDTPGAEYSLLAMTDGMIGRMRTKKDLASYLNQHGMIPMPHNWLIATMNYLRDCYETP